jgi:hypothetical protein
MDKLNKTSNCCVDGQEVPQFHYTQQDAKNKDILLQLTFVITAQ